MIAEKASSRRDTQEKRARHGSVKASRERVVLLERRGPVHDCGRA
jgi:hypothetical protein